MISKIALKYKLFEWALDTLFNKISLNFSSYKFDLKVGQRFQKIIYNGNEYHNCIIIKYDTGSHGFLLFIFSYILHGNNVTVGFMGKDLDTVNKICNFPHIPQDIIDSDVYLLVIPKSSFYKYQNEINRYIYIQTGLFGGESETIKDFLFI